MSNWHQKCILKLKENAKIKLYCITICTIVFKF